MTGLKTVSSYTRTQSHSRSKQKQVKVLFIDEVHLAALSPDNENIKAPEMSQGCLASP